MFDADAAGVGLIDRWEAEDGVGVEDGTFGIRGSDSGDEGGVSGGGPPAAGAAPLLLPVILPAPGFV